MLRDLAVGGSVLAALGWWSASRFGDGRPSGRQTLDLREAAPDPDDASPAFAELVAELARSGGGVLHVPPGRWALSESLTLDAPNITVVGTGLRATKLVMADGIRSSVVSILADGVTLQRMTIVGNLASLRSSMDQGLPHGVRVGNNARHVRIADLVIEDAAGYGIGFQPSGGTDRLRGTFDHFAIENVSIIGCGHDGIDIKNYDSANPACPDETYDEQPRTPDSCNGGRSFLKNVSVDRHSLLFGHPDRKSGIDIRGGRQLENIEVLNVRPGAIGVHFRTDVGGYPNGRGAQWSTLVNCHVSLTPGDLGALPAVAVLNPDVRGCVVDVLSTRTVA